ncbi:MAG TPA: hypothetical protein VJ508_14650, partial [Saprospiraceae bacterium]|nr:hypothetical protein [Saprospiraceae bacterium]
MNNHTLKFLILYLFFAQASSLRAHVALDYPHGGETFIEGQVVHITWHIVAFHATLNWDLYFSSDGGSTWEPILLDIPHDSLSHTWIVPSTFTSQARVRVIQDNVMQDYYGTSMDFTILPNTDPPSLDAPAVDTIIDCDSGQQIALQTWLNNHGGAAASNHCGALVWTNDFGGLSDECGGTGSAIVTFTATDVCGSTFTIATVTIVDHTAPTFITYPEDISVECDGHGNSAEFQQWLNTHGGAEASDACGTVTWSYLFAPSAPGCAWSGIAHVIFKASDECGNSSSATGLFTIVDTVAPELVSAAQDKVIECSPVVDQVIQAWLDNHGGAMATDLCGNVSWSNNYTGLVSGCGGTGSAVVIFTAADECGNTTTSQATISVVDHQPPFMVTLPQDTIIMCDVPDKEAVIQSWLGRHGGDSAYDLCGNIVWTHDSLSIQPT